MELTDDREDAEWERDRGGESGWEKTIEAWSVVVADEVVESGGGLNFALLAVADLGESMSSGGGMKVWSWSRILERVFRRSGRSWSDGMTNPLVLEPLEEGSWSSSGV